MGFSGFRSGIVEVLLLLCCGVTFQKNKDLKRSTAKI